MAIISASNPAAASPPSNISLHASRVKQYLEDTIEAIDESYSFSASSIHRKSMIRALLGCPKAELDALLNELEESQKWNATTQFIHDNLSTLKSLPVAEDANDTFQEGLQSFAEFESRGANKLFAFMARGRSYQGKFERLLQDAASDKPEWLKFYENRIQTPLSETERLELLIDADLSRFCGRSNNRRLDDTNELTIYLDKCIHYPFEPPAFQQPADGGKARGEASEYDLLSYLKQVLIPDNQQDSDQHKGQSIQVLAPVTIQNRRKDRNPRNPNKMRSCVIDLPEEVNLHGLTSELDALVVQIEEDTQTLQILQVWEAKAALNPMSIGDALQKKTQIVQEIVHHANDSSMILTDGRSFQLKPTFESHPSIGIFGKTLANPASASRRVQTVIGETLVATDAMVVQQVLDGDNQICIPPETVKHRLSALQDLADQWKPTLVLSSDDFVPDTSPKVGFPKSFLSLFVVMFLAFVLPSEAIKFQPVPRHLLTSICQSQTLQLDQIKKDKRKNHRFDFLSTPVAHCWSNLQQQHQQGWRVMHSLTSLQPHELPQYLFLDTAIHLFRGGARNGSPSPSRLYQSASISDEDSESLSSEQRDPRDSQNVPNLDKQNNPPQNKIQQQSVNGQSRQVFTRERIPQRRPNHGNHCRTYRVTVCQEQGKRKYMEDSVLVGNECLAVFDGHGGKKVSQYLKLNLLAEIQLAKMVFEKSNSQPSNEKADGNNRGSNLMRSKPTTSSASSIARNVSTKDYVEILAMSLDKLDQDVQRISHWSFQGSTAVVVWLHETKRPLPFFASLEESPRQTASRTSKPQTPKPKLRPMPQGPPTVDHSLIVANIGDSRAILSRQGRPISLTRDHKPNDDEERAYIESLGGRVTVRGTIARVNGNLSLSRAIGDKAERPFVRATPEFTTIPIQKDDDFVVIATDGLWDVMNNWEVVDFILARSKNRKATSDPGNHDKENDITRALVQEALDRGSSDNISVVILWLNK